MIGEPMTDSELDVIEQAAHALIQAVDVQDFDTAYIVASTCPNPAMLAMFVAEVGRG